MAEDKTKTPQTPAPEAEPGTPPAATPRCGTPALAYVNFFLALVALIGLAAILMDPATLVPDGLTGRLDGVVQTAADHTLTLDSVKERLDRLEQGQAVREALVEAQTAEIAQRLEYLATQSQDPERKAALEPALQALRPAP